MKKKLNLFLILLLLAIPLNVNAAYLSPIKTLDASHAYMDWEIFDSYKLSVNYNRVVTEYELNPAGASGRIVFNCVGKYYFTFYDNYGDGIQGGTIDIDLAKINDKACNPSAPYSVTGASEIPPIEEPGGTDPGEGGTGGDETGGTDPGSGAGTGGDGTGTGGDGTGSGGSGSDGGTGGTCDACEMFECPGWGEYMGKLNEIKNKIPPPPNWPEVADTFRDSIVPKMISELDTLLGTAPDPPSAPAQLPGLDDRGINSMQPSMNDIPGLSGAGFTSDQIKNQAPVITERPDPTGGFNLLENPMDTLPDAPTNPKPGATDPGAWGENKPAAQENPFPFPQDTGEPDIGTPPTPGDAAATPPMPGGDSGSAPTPDGDVGTAPTPGGTGGDPNMKDYKPSPGSPDGSGKVIYP